MTLGRKIVFNHLLLLLGLALLCGGSFWGLLGLRQDVNTALEYHTDLQHVQAVIADTTAVRAVLRDSVPGRKIPLDRLGTAQSRLQSYIADVKTGQMNASGYNHRMIADAESALVKLQQAAAALGSAQASGSVSPAMSSAVADTLDEASTFLDSVLDKCDAFVDRTQHSAGDRMQLAMIIMAISSAGIVVLAVLFGARQYRAVILPLRRLRDGVRHVAAGQFVYRLPAPPDAEFAELATEFNGMAAELDDFYRRLEEKVVQASKRLVLSERLASVGFLAGGVAHEINNPLSIISGYAELSIQNLKKMEQLDEPKVRDIMEWLHIIRDEAFRCKQITEKLLSMTRPGDASREPVALASVASDVARMVGGLTAFHDRRLKVRLDESDSLTVEANANEMKQVLLNLTVNALQAVEPGAGEVSIEGRRSDGWVEMAVKDNGRGMSREVLDRVFEPFFTSRRGFNEPGTGLGLSITHAIVERHGGCIVAQSEGPGCGSKFVVRFPARKVIA